MLAESVAVARMFVVVFPPTVTVALNVPLAEAVLIPIGDPEQFEVVYSRTAAPDSAVPKMVGVKEAFEGDGGETERLVGGGGGIVSAT